MIIRGITFVISLTMLIIGIIKQEKIIVASGTILLISVILAISFYGLRLHGDVAYFLINNIRIPYIRNSC